MTLGHGDPVRAGLGPESSAAGGEYLGSRVGTGAAEPMAEGQSSSSWDGTAYSSAAGHHRVLDDWFLRQRAPAPGERVVDVGCGSGDFTAVLADLASPGRVIGVEPDSSMLAAAARHDRANLEFRRGRAQELDSVCEPSSADIVVSRAAFHWISLADYPRCYAAIHRVLRPGGWFHAESGAAGNVSAIVELLDSVATRHALDPARVAFPDPGITFEMLEDAGFEIPDEGVRSVAQRREFDAHQLVAALRTQAVLAYAATEGPEARESLVADAQTRLDELRRTDGTFDQTFVRLHVLVRKPS